VSADDSREATVLLVYTAVWGVSVFVVILISIKFHAYIYIVRAVFASEGLDERLTLGSSGREHRSRKGRKKGFAENVSTAQNVQKGVIAMHSAVEKSRHGGPKERRHGGKQKTKPGVGKKQRTTEDHGRSRGRQR